MSDGACSNGENEMINLYSDLKLKGLITYTLAFGSADQRKLSSLASICGGHCLSSVSEIDLKGNFLEISSSLGTKISVTKSFK